jgi:acyl carrier protein
MTPTTIRTGVIAAIAQLVGRRADQISDRDNLIDDLGVDSLIAVNLLRSIEDGLGVRLPEGSESSLVGIWTVGELVERLALLFADDMTGNRDHTCRTA